jgi:uncharacterized membrane protein YqjE
MDTRPEDGLPAHGVDAGAAASAAKAAGAAQDANAPLPSLGQLMGELQATLLALAALARSELHLSFALLLRATLLTLVGLLLLGLALLLGCALLVASGLALGLSWPAALALSLLVLLGSCALCWRRASRHLGECGLPRTRRQLSSLWPEQAP